MNLTRVRGLLVQAAFGVVVASGPAVAQTPLSLTNTATPYTQDFNTLRLGGSGTLPGITNFVNLAPYPQAAPSAALAGWRHRTLAPSPTFNADDGTTATGRAYSYGAAGDTDRAFGLLTGGSGVTSTAHVFGLLVRNDTGAAINSITVGYTGEQWRSGSHTAGDADRLDFSYGLGTGGGVDIIGGTYTNVDALDFNSPNTSGVPGALNGNDAANRTALSQVIDFSNGWQAGETLVIRWADFDVASGTDDGLAIEDFQIFVTPVPEPAGLLAVGGLAVAGWRLRRRRAG